MKITWRVLVTFHEFTYISRGAWNTLLTYEQEKRVFDTANGFEIRDPFLQRFLPPWYANYAPRPEENYPAPDWTDCFCPSEVQPILRTPVNPAGVGLALLNYRTEFPSHNPLATVHSALWRAARHAHSSPWGGGFRFVGWSEAGEHYDRNFINSLLSAPQTTLEEYRQKALQVARFLRDEEEKASIGYSYDFNRAVDVVREFEEVFPTQKFLQTLTIEEQNAPSIAERIEAAWFGNEPFYSEALFVIASLLRVVPVLEV